MIIADTAITYLRVEHIYYMSWLSTSMASVSRLFAWRKREIRYFAKTEKNVCIVNTVSLSFFGLDLLR